MRFSPCRDGFVSLGEYIPEVLLEIRYYSAFNFVGERIDGYEEPAALMTREAAEALRGVSREMGQRGLLLKIYDAYRPQGAVDHFMRWAADPGDLRMKAFFYPDLAKDRIIPEGYIAEHSGHSRGSTVDLTLFDMRAGRDLDMGGPFDFFGERSHASFAGVSPEQRGNRMLLREAMERGGFRPLEEEWWHFTLREEPFPETFFTFPVRQK